MSLPTLLEAADLPGVAQLSSEAGTAVTGPGTLQLGPHCPLVLFFGTLARFIPSTYFFIFNDLLVKCLGKIVLETNHFQRSLFIET